MKLFIALAFVLTAFNSMAFDLHGKGTAVILIDQTKESVKYSFCYDVKKKDTCRVLGSKQVYLKSEVDSVRRTYKWKNAGILAGGIGSGVATAFLGVMTFAAPNPVFAAGVIAAGSGSAMLIDKFARSLDLTGTGLCEDTYNDVYQKLNYTNKELAELALEIEGALNSIS